jgi:LSD1 subclass zinc finger protein
MTASYSGFDVRLLMCRSCGASLDVPMGGGSIKCEYCSAVSVISARPIEHKALVAPDPADVAERDRLALLRAQAKQYDDSKDRYSLDNQPAGYEDVDGFDVSEATAKKLEQGFREALIRYEAAPSAESERLVFWLAERAANLFSMTKQSLRKRAVVETAAEVLEDAGYRQFMFLRLAGLARGDDDLESASQWMAQCDAKSSTLAVDSNYRTDLGLLYICQDDYRNALATVGEATDEIPFNPSHRPMAFLIRASAFEGMGRNDAAEATVLKTVDFIAELTASSNLDKGPEAEVRAACRNNAISWLGNILHDSKAHALCRQAWERLVQRDVLPSIDSAVKEFQDGFSKSPNEPEPEPEAADFFARPEQKERDEGAGPASDAKSSTWLVAVIAIVILGAIALFVFL